MNESLDIFIEQYLDELIGDLKEIYSIEIYNLIRNSVKYTIVCEINMHIHNDKPFSELSIPSQTIMARWEKYEVQARKGIDHEEDSPI